jgi:phosphomethylpyrimidine synthase
MKITEDVRKYAAEQELSDEEASQSGMAQKSCEFSETGAEIYSNHWAHLMGGTRQ